LGACCTLRCPVDLMPSVGPRERAFGDAVQPDALDHSIATGRVGKMWSLRDCIDLEYITMGAVPRRRIRRQIFRSQERVLAEQAAWLPSRRSTQLAFRKLSIKRRELRHN